MTKKSRFTRLFAGMAVTLVFLGLAFSITNAFIPFWGSTPEEQALVLPGDSWITSPVMQWKHAITIDAAPEQVWPWLAQMGDTRGGFYSYSWIEKTTNALFGSPVTTSYNNARQVHPEWQNPQIGQGMILDALVLREIVPNTYLLAGPGPKANETGLFWSWHIRPTGDGRTRLITHMAVQIPGASPNPVVSGAMNLLTFMMERRMITGIQLRAEGGSEPDWVQPAELAVGLAALFLGLVAARRFVTRPGWKIPLATGLAAVAALFVLVYLQPPVWAGLLIDLALAAALVIDRPAAIHAARLDLAAAQLNLK